MSEKTYKEKTEDIIEAIRKGKKFYVDTFIGKLEVQGIDPDGSWARTGTGFQTRSWAICSREIDAWHKQIKKEDK